MYTTEYLNADFIPAKKKQGALEILQLLQDQKLTHIPVFDRMKFIGNIAEEDLLDMSYDDASDYENFAEKFYVSNAHTVLDAIKMMHQHHANMVPVLDSEEKYLGTILQSDVMDRIATTLFMEEAGAEMLLTIPTVDLSVAAIANIVESHNSKLLGVFILGQEEDRSKVLIKVRSENILSIGETLERYGYQVIQKYYNDEKTGLMTDRYNQLLKYINL
ncbi:CBS domain-containing protein [Vaginella massiliensis]|uniref:CBS domain-containing protein n=1 Tax=Vaginella massiliensis TaxID=1816680 RepID=UPI000838D940|nr:CBS domain-containing protein [Vaginella massiliensis]